MTIKKTVVPAIVGISLLAVALTAFGPVFAQTSDPTAPTAPAKMPDIAGSVNVGKTMKDYITSHRTTSFSDAAKTAESKVTNGVVMNGGISVVQGYLVYSFRVVDTDSNTMYNVIVDAGNGQMLYKSDGTTMKGFGGFGHKGSFGFGGFEHSKKMMPTQQGYTQDSSIGTSEHL